MDSISPCLRFFFFFNDTATTEIYTLSLHDALPIFAGPHQQLLAFRRGAAGRHRAPSRSEEHTSELQSHSHLVCRLLLENKINNSPPNRTFRLLLPVASCGVPH